MGRTEVAGADRGPPLSLSLFLPFSLLNLHQLVLHQGQVVVLLHSEGRWLGDLHAAPLVHGQPHGPLEHVDLCVTQDHCGAGLHQIDCQKGRRKKERKKAKEEDPSPHEHLEHSKVNGNHASI